jgi:exopolysaccharide production protein ExoZ
LNPVVELFRGIGAWMVLNSHYAHYLFNDRSVLNFLWTGVYLFFVISGFVFAGTILYKDIGIIPFALRRFFRIYPLYAFSLVLYFFLVQDDPQKITYFVRHLFFLNTIVSLKETFFFNPAYWSLPPEVEFYISIPILIYIRKRYGQHIILSLLPLLLGIKFVLVLNYADPSVSENIFNILGVHLPGKAPEFFTGILLYKAYERYSGNNVSPLYPLLSLMSGIFILFVLGWYFVAYGNEGINKYIFIKAFYTFFCSVGYALILFSVLILFNKKKDMNFASHFMFLGSLSYSVYLFHSLVPLIISKTGIVLGQPITYIICSVAVFLLSIPCSRYIENPCRNFGKNLSAAFGNR